MALGRMPSVRYQSGTAFSPPWEKVPEGRMSNCLHWVT
jgi:hypothetical protein